MKKIKLERLVKLLVIVYLHLVIIIGCSFQEDMIFPAQKLYKDHSFSSYLNGVEVELVTQDSVKISGIYYKNFPEGDVVLYFHGNSGSLEGWRFEYEEYYKQGLNMLMIDYRSYGKSEGEVTEEGLYLDGDAAYLFLLRQGFKDEQIIAYGRSIGTGIATEVAKEKRLKYLVLETPYTALSDLVYDRFWFLLPWFYLSYDLDSCEKMEKVMSPLIIIHGTNDTVIPYEYGEELLECFEGEKQMITVPHAGHNSIGRFPQKAELLKLISQ